MGYDHTQTAPLYLILFAIAIGFLIGGTQIDNPEVFTIPLILAALLFSPWALL